MLGTPQSSVMSVSAPTGAAPVPSEFITNSSSCTAMFVPGSLTKAILLPSGDQATSQTSRRPPASCTSPPPAGLTARIWETLA